MNGKKRKKEQVISGQLDNQKMGQRMGISTRICTAEAERVRETEMGTVAR